MALPAWVPAAESKPAPMPLLVVQSFVNTWEGDSGVDLLADPVAGPRWLREAGLVRGDDVDLADARALRALADRARLRPVVLDDGEVDLQPDEDPGPSSMAALLLIIRDA